MLVGACTERNDIAAGAGEGIRQGGAALHAAVHGAAVTHVDEEGRTGVRVPAALVPEIEMELALVPPGQRRFVDGSRGEDEEEGGAIDDPWRTIGYALTRLEAGQTLYIREGTYDEGGLEVGQRGDAERWTTIRAFPFERVRIDASEVAFRSGRADAWELVDGRTGLYRSREVHDEEDVYTGKAMLPDGGAFTLVPYHDKDDAAYGLADLVSTTYAVSTGARYVGPGMYNDEGRLYIRLQRLPSNALHGRDPFPPFPEDPNELALQLTVRSAVLQITGSHVEVRDLALAGAKVGIEMKDGVHDVRVRDVDFSIPGGALLFREDVTDVLIDGNRIAGHFPPWVAWTDMKGAAGGQSRPASYTRFRVSGGGGDFVENLVVTNNVFDNVFDGMVIEGSYIRFVGNRGSFVDDMIQLGSNSDNVEIAHNVARGVGPSHDGNGDSAEPGTIFVHHNVIDATSELLWGKADPEGRLRAGYRGWHSHKPFPDHSSSELGRGDPWKIYSNTLVFDGASSSDGAGFQLFGKRNATGVPHEVYNNVLIEVGGGEFARHISIEAGPQVYDGNVYFRRGGASAGAPLLDDISAKGETQSFASLEAFRASDTFRSTRRWYAPGWEANGVEGDPGLDVHLRPLPGRPAADGAVPLPGHFPGERHAHRGALPPVVPVR